MIGLSCEALGSFLRRSSRIVKNSDGSSKRMDDADHVCSLPSVDDMWRRNQTHTKKSAFHDHMYRRNTCTVWVKSPFNTALVQAIFSFYCFQMPTLSNLTSFRFAEFLLPTSIFSARPRRDTPATTSEKHPQVESHSVGRGVPGGDLPRDPYQQGARKVHVHRVTGR